MERNEDAAYWKNNWEKDTIPWHITEPHKLLKAHLDKLVNGRSDIKVFFPLCGKAVDIKWLSDMGHSAAGIDVSDVALKSFFTESGEEYSTAAVPALEGELYKGIQSKTELYCGDLFKFSPDIAGQYDGIWDRGSFEAIDLNLRKKYADLMLSLMNDDCCYLLAAIDFDKHLWKGIGPKGVNLEDLVEVYGDACTVEQLYEGEETKVKGIAGYPWTLEKLFLIKKKKA